MIQPNLDEQFLVLAFFCAGIILGYLFGYLKGSDTQDNKGFKEYD